MVSKGGQAFQRRQNITCLRLSWQEIGSLGENLLTPLSLVSTVIWIFQDQGTDQNAETDAGQEFLNPNQKFKVENGIRLL